MKQKLKGQTIAFPTPVYIVATYSEDGKANAMNVAWGGICSSEPPCVMISIRRDRKTYDNILAKKAFTVNIPAEGSVKEADYFGMASGKKVDKIEKAGLSTKACDAVDAPYIEEFPFALACKLVKTVELESHVQLIGEIVDIYVDDACLDSDGKPDIAKIKPMLYDPVDNTYYGVGKEVEKAFSAGKELLK